MPITLGPALEHSGVTLRSASIAGQQSDWESQKGRTKGERAFGRTLPQRDQRPSSLTPTKPKGVKHLQLMAKHSSIRDKFTSPLCFFSYYRNEHYHYCEWHFTYIKIFWRLMIVQYRCRKVLTTQTTQLISLHKRAIKSYVRIYSLLVWADHNMKEDIRSEPQCIHV